MTARAAADSGLRTPPWAAPAGLALTALAVAALAAERVWLIPVHVSFNPDEGWNAFQAARAWGAGPLYPPPGGLVGDNYPPLSFLLVGGLARLLGGDLIVTGRGVALLSLLATAAAAGWAVRRLDPGRSWAPWAAALLVLGFAATQFRAYLAMDDPQWLAHALMTPALALVLPVRPGGSPDLRRTAAAALLAAAGGLVKHNLLALPVAVTLWLLMHHRRALLAWAATGAAAVALSMAGVGWTYGWAALRDILQAPRHVSWARMFTAAGPLSMQLPLLTAAWPLLRLRGGDRRLDLPLLFVAVAVPLGVLQRGGQGVNFNAHFEALVALSVGGGAVLAHALAAPGRKTAARGVVLWLLPFAVLVPLAVGVAITELKALAVERAAWPRMERRIAEVRGPVACQTLALCFWAGEPFALDYFLYGQQVARTHDASALLDALDAGAVAGVERDPPRPPKRGDLPDVLAPLLDARDAVLFRAEDGRRLEAPRRFEPAAAVAAPRAVRGSAVSIPFGARSGGPT